MKDFSKEDVDDYQHLQRIYLGPQTREPELPANGMRLRRVVRPAQIESRPDLK